MGAAWRGHIKIVQQLLANGANLHARTTEGKNAVSLANEWSHQSVVDILVAAGAALPAAASPTSTATTSTDQVAITISR